MCSPCGRRCRGPSTEATARRADFYSRVIEQVRRLPGVSSAAYISFLPMVMRGGIWAVEVEGQRPERVHNRASVSRFVTPGLFASLGIPVRADVMSSMPTLSRHSRSRS